MLENFSERANLIFGIGFGVVIGHCLATNDLDFVAAGFVVMAGAFLTAKSTLSATEKQIAHQQAEVRVNRFLQGQRIQRDVVFALKRWLHDLCRDDYQVDMGKVQSKVVELDELANLLEGLAPARYIAPIYQARDRFRGAALYGPDNPDIRAKLIKECSSMITALESWTIQCRQEAQFLPFTPPEPN